MMLPIIHRGGIRSPKTVARAHRCPGAAGRYSQDILQRVFPVVETGAVSFLQVHELFP